MPFSSALRRFQGSFVARVNTGTSTRRGGWASDFAKNSFYPKIFGDGSATISTRTSVPTVLVNQCRFGTSSSSRATGGAGGSRRAEKTDRKVESPPPHSSEKASPSAAKASKKGSSSSSPKRTAAATADRAAAVIFDEGKPFSRRFTGGATDDSTTSSTSYPSNALGPSHYEFDQKPYSSVFKTSSHQKGISPPPSAFAAADSTAAVVYYDRESGKRLPPPPDVSEGDTLWSWSGGRVEPPIGRRRTSMSTGTSTTNRRAARRNVRREDGQYHNEGGYLV